MATAGGGAARRKRPWRKPREAKGPEEPLRSVRASPLSYITGHHVVMEEEAKDKEEEQQPRRDEPMALETSGHEQMISRGGDGRRDSKGGGRNSGQDDRRGGGDQGGDFFGGGGSSVDKRFLEIDGSIMEGVSLVQSHCLIVGISLYCRAGKYCAMQRHSAAYCIVLYTLLILEQAGANLDSQHST